MKKRFILSILALFLSFSNISFAVQKVNTAEYKITADDGFVLYSTLQYPKVKNKSKYQTVVLLHSLGYNSNWWEDLPQQLLNEGYAVVKIDLRGHGKSVYNSKLHKISWASLNDKAYQKYPDDIIKVLDYIKSENKRIFFENWAIVGCDIGASAGIIASNRLSYKPSTIVLLSPVVKAKSLYVPVDLAELNNIDILSISGQGDLSGQNAQNYLKRFAQSSFSTYVSESKSTGILLLKNDKTVSKIIVKWLEAYLKDK